MPSSKSPFLIDGQDEDYYQAKKNYERKEKKKLFDNIDSILYRLDMERVKPSFEVQLQTGFRRSSLRNKKRFSRATSDRSPSEDRYSVRFDTLPLDRSRNRSSRCEPQNNYRKENLYDTDEPPPFQSRFRKSQAPADKQADPNRYQFGQRKSPAPNLYMDEPRKTPTLNDYRSTERSGNQSPSRYQSEQRRTPMRTGYGDLYGGESALQHMKTDFLGKPYYGGKWSDNESRYGTNIDNSYYVSPERRNASYPEKNLIYPTYTTRYRVFTPEPDRGNEEYYGRNNNYPTYSRGRSYHSEFEGPGQTLLSEFRAARETRPTYGRTTNDNDWTRLRSQSTPPNMYRSTYSPAAEYRNFGLGVVGRKVVESHMELDYLDRLINRTFGKKGGTSYLPSPETYYVDRFSQYPPAPLSHLAPDSSMYKTSYYVPSMPAVQHVVSPKPFVRSVLTFSYPAPTPLPKAEPYVINRRHSVLISPATRVTSPGLFLDTSPTSYEISKSNAAIRGSSNPRLSMPRKTRPMSYAAGSNLDYYKEKLRI